MRPLLTAGLALLAAAGLAGCSSPCQELGEKLCDCRPETQSKRTCENQVRRNLEQLDPSKEQEELCEAKLKTCEDARPDDVAFCTWIQGTDGKVACGLAPEPEPADP